MKDVLYGLLLGATDLDDARYRSHSRGSGMNLPRTLDGFYAIAHCCDKNLDYRNFEPSVAETLGHSLDHQQDILAAAIFPQENYFGNLDVEIAKSKVKDLSEILGMMLRVRIYQKRMYQRIVDSRITGDTKPLVDIFNEAMKYYRELVLPTTRDLLKISADGTEERKSELIEKFRKSLKPAATTA